MALPVGWLWWQPWSPLGRRLAVTPRLFCVTGVALGGRRVTCGTGLALAAALVAASTRLTSFAWQAWHLATSALIFVALGDIHAPFVWQAWHLRHWAGSGGGFGSRLVAAWFAVTPRLFCVAGDICFTFVWQAWHLVTSVCLSCGRRSPAGSVGGLHRRLVGSWSLWHRRFCVAGALMPSLEQEGVSSFGSEEMQVVEEFLDSGSAPVYIGFGSIVCITSKFMALLCLRALRLTGERAILCRGWSTMCLEDLQGEVDEEDLKAYCHEKVLFVDKAPHGWLFPKCQVVVHHGGAGTLHASAMSGRPTVIVPIFVDQPEHSELVNKRGFGVGLKSMQKAKPLELADAIRKCINTPSIQAKAKEVAEQMKKEDASERNWSRKRAAAGPAVAPVLGRVVRQAPTIEEKLRIICGWASTSPVTGSSLTGRPRRKQWFLMVSDGLRCL
eukprot:s3382_g3.t1